MDPQVSFPPISKGTKGNLPSNMSKSTSDFQSLRKAEYPGVEILMSQIMGDVRNWGPRAPGKTAKPANKL